MSSLKRRDRSPAPSPSPDTFEPVSKRPHIVVNSLSDAPAVTGTVFVWGDGSMGQLGFGDLFDSLEKPHPLTDLPDTIVDIVAGPMHNLVLTKEGLVYSWGVNDDGALGRNANNNGKSSYIFD